jgi:hypothetical protein
MNVSCGRQKRNHDRKIVKSRIVLGGAAVIRSLYLCPSLVRALHTATQHERKRQLYLQKEPHHDAAPFAHALHLQLQRLTRRAKVNENVCLTVCMPHNCGAMAERIPSLPQKKS